MKTKLKRISLLIAIMYITLYALPSCSTETQKNDIDNYQEQITKKWYDSVEIEDKETTISASIKSASIFSEGMAVMLYQSTAGPKEDLYAMVDTSGNIIYSEKFEYGTRSSLYYSPFAYHNILPLPFSGVTCTKNNVINKSGEIIYTANNNEVIECWGDGLVIISESLSSVDGTKIICKIINSSGKTVQKTELTAAEKLLGCSYAGCGVFQFHVMKKDTNHALTLWNSSTGNKKTLSWTGEEIQFIDNVALYRSNAENNIFSSIDINFNETVIGKGNYASGGYLIYHDEYVSIIDLKTNKTIKFTEYSAEKIEKIEMKNKKGIVYLKSSDGNKFFTVIDENAKMLFEPIRYIHNLYFSDNKIVYEGDYFKFCVINTNGETISQFELNCNIYGFNESILIGKYQDQDNYHYFDINGKKIFEVLYS